MRLNLICDFDSTFISKESLEELAETALKQNIKRSEIRQRIEAITNAGMNGEISFQKSLKERICLFSANQSHIDKTLLILQRNISKSFVENKDFFKKNAENIYIISGGFKELILPILRNFGIKDDHVYANEFIFDENGNILGFDENNLMSQDKGKVKTIRKLNFKGKNLVLGDGYTDYEIKKEGLANEFIAYCEHVQREKVLKVADQEISDFNDFLKIFYE